MKSLDAINAGLYLSTCPICAFMPFLGICKVFLQFLKGFSYWFSMKNEALFL